MWRAARESRKPEEAQAWLAEPASYIPAESLEWRVERACRTWAAEALGERTAPVAAARAWKTRAYIRSDPAERAVAEALPEELVWKPVERPAQ